MRRYWQQRNAGWKRESLPDGYGSPDLSDEFEMNLTAAGVVFRYDDPRPRLFGMRPTRLLDASQNCGD
ncbi:hypothetical protein ACNKHN_04195 [Shigella flexneri]